MFEFPPSKAPLKSQNTLIRRNVVLYFTKRLWTTTIWCERIEIVLKWILSTEKVQIPLPSYQSSICSKVSRTSVPIFWDGFRRKEDIMGNSFLKCGTKNDPVDGWDFRSIRSTRSTRDITGTILVLRQDCIFGMMKSITTSTLLVWPLLMRSRDPCKARVRVRVRILES